MPLPESVLLVVDPLPLIPLALSFQLDEVLLECGNVQLLGVGVLLNHLLNFLHFLVEHLEELGILLILDFHLVKLLLLEISYCFRARF